MHGGSVGHVGKQILKDCQQMELSVGYAGEDEELGLDQVPESSQIPQHLNRLLSNVANIEYCCSLLLTAQNRLESQLKRLPGGYCPGVCTELREQLDYTQESLRDISNLTKRSKDLVQAMVQTVSIHHERS